MSYDEAFSVNHTAEMAEPYFTFLREQEAKARRLHAAANAVNASQEAKDAITGSVYENYTEGMFWSAADEDEVQGAQGSWSHIPRAEGGGAEDGAMSDGAPGEGGDAMGGDRWAEPVRMVQANARGLGDVLPVWHLHVCVACVYICREYI